MNKIINICVAIFLVTVLFSFFYSFAEERITLTTYYPAPYGVYREMRVNGLAVGSAYRNNPVNITDGNLIVGNRLGIGTDPINWPVLQIEAEGAASGRQAFITVKSIDGQAGIQFESDSTGPVWVYSPDNKDSLEFKTNGTDRMSIEFGGNVGIGTVTPSTKLEVAGSASFGGNLNTTGSAYFGGNLNTTDVWLRSVNRWASQGSSCVVRVSSGGGGTHTIQCNAGEICTGGGQTINSVNDDNQWAAPMNSAGNVVANGETPTGWKCFADESNTCYAVCCQ